MIIVGIDPGLTGAIASLDTETRKIIAIVDMPTNAWKNTRGKKIQEVNEQQLAHTLVSMNPEVVIIERVSSMTGQGVTSSFNFGMHFGVIRGVVGGLGISYQLVQPKAWKTYYRLGSDKGQARAVASRLFPDMADMFKRVKDDGRAEASLIAAFMGAH
jgi:crossover junction endodeoxyribonuclease RuvC